MTRAINFQERKKRTCLPNKKEMSPDEQQKNFVAEWEALKN